uniref:cell division inhibitor SulA n=1 Tax=Marinobacterium profundum TaxID=1714300 RepID=UPI00082CC60E|nr:SulA-like leucine-rich domain-containing protein [Marinobacterium profundum]
MNLAPIPKYRRTLCQGKRQNTVSTKASPSNKNAGKLTEIITHDSNLSSMPLLMPLLAQLSRDDRWFAWVAPPALLPKTLLTDAGIDLGKVILLQPDSGHSVFDLARRALSAGTCHAVISWPGYLSEFELKALEQAAACGDSHGILIRGREHA